MVTSASPSATIQCSDRFGDFEEINTFWFNHYFLTRNFLPEASTSKYPQGFFIIESINKYIYILYINKNDKNIASILNVKENDLENKVKSLDNSWGAD